MAPVVQTRLPFDITPRALPGVRPLDPDDWIAHDEAFAGQMACRDALLATRRTEVLAIDPAAQPAATELLRSILDVITRHPDRGYAVSPTEVMRPDGVTVDIAWDDPLGTAGRLVQEDLCLLQKQGDAHVLTGAVLCFPASWRLDEKFMRPLIGIHEPVASYDADIARRVQRLFDGVQPGRPLWRFNRLWYADATLHQPRSMHARRASPPPGQAPYMRSEKQAILRLPETGAVVFAIHTYVVAAEAVPPEQR